MLKVAVIAKYRLDMSLLSLIADYKKYRKERKSNGARLFSVKWLIYFYVDNYTMSNIASRETRLLFTAPFPSLFFFHHIVMSACSLPFSCRLRMGPEIAFV